MTNYHLKPTDTSPPDQTLQEAKERRMTVLAAMRSRRREMYRQFAQKKRQLQANDDLV